MGSLVGIGNSKQWDKTIFRKLQWNPFPIFFLKIQISYFFQTLHVFKVFHGVCCFWSIKPCKNVSQLRNFLKIFLVFPFLGYSKVLLWGPYTKEVFIVSQVPYHLPFKYVCLIVSPLVYTCSPMVKFVHQIHTLIYFHHFVLFFRRYTFFFR